jgi:hypothetical protein
MQKRVIKLGPAAEIAAASFKPLDLQRLKVVLEKLRLPVEERRGELSVRRLRPESKQFVVKVGELYRLIYHRSTPTVVTVDDIVRVDHLRALEG